MELTPKRKAVIDKYLELQEGFKTLHNKAILTYIAIYKEQMETDIDKVKKGMPKKQIAKIPKVSHKYLQYMIAPYIVQVGDGDRGMKCIDTLETEIIELFNERIGIKLEVYKDYLTNTKENV